MTETSELKALLLQEIRNAGDWLSRADLARRINRPHNLYTYDIQVLGELVDAGLIEVTQVQTGAVRKEYRYRAKEG